MFHPFQARKDLAPRAPIQLPLSLIYKTDLLAKVVLCFNVITDFMYNIDTIMWVEFVVGSLALALRGFFCGYFCFPNNSKFQFNMECMSTCKFVSKPITFTFTVIAH